jgi:hypothetical protein
MTFDEVIEFRKDMKRLSRKFRSLSDDMATVKQILAFDPDARPPFSYRIDGLKIRSCVIKIRKISCRSLKYKGVNSGLRVIYAYFREEPRIVFIEIYHKSDKSMEDRERIYRYFK